MALLTKASREMLHRDAQCAADVGRMEEFGRFPTEFKVYGTASWEENGKIYYRATTDEEKLYDYIQQKKSQGIYFTPIVSHVRYLKVFAEMKEQTLYDTKYFLLQQMKQQYEGLYFELMEPLFVTPPNNQSCPFLEQYRDCIDGYFDDAGLQIFRGLLEMAYDAKILKPETYTQFSIWHDQIRHQMADEAVAEDRYKRTFYGFKYKTKDGIEKLFADARRMTAVNKREILLLNGCLTGSILKKSYWFSNLEQINAIKNQYKQWLSEVQNETYFHLLETLKKQKGVITQQQINELEKRMKAYPTAYHGFYHYAVRWNRA